jgi:DNA helicase IV
VNQEITAELARELDAERQHLRRARACLAAMRQRAAALPAAGGDEIATDVLRGMLANRALELADDAGAPLFFGRVDYAGAAELGGQSFHLGRRHVHDELLNPVVVDWRAQVARPFYRASSADPWGLGRRRRFGFAGGELTSLQDERFEDASGDRLAEAALRAEIERPRIGPMRDIVATIQPEQDDLVRAPLERTICIQGGPGTGKTAVGLHRAAYLLYEHRERLRRDGVLVVGPTRAFLAFIGQVLPGLGETDVAQHTVAEVAGVWPVRGRDPAAAAAVKADARMAAVLRRAVFQRVRLPTEPLTVAFAASAVHLPVRALRALVAGLLEGDAPYAARQALLWERLGRACQQRAEAAGNPGYESIDDAVRAVRRSAAARRFVAAAWPPARPAELLFELLAEVEPLRAAADGILDPAEQAALRWPARPRSRAAARWSAADAFLLDELAAVVDWPPGYGHVVIDEAQDLSPMQLRALGRRCRFGSATLLGDLAQGTTPWSADRWETTLAHLGKPDGQVLVLPRAFRAPRRVLDLANRLLPAIAPQVRPARSVREVPDALEVRRVPAGELTAAAVRAARDALAREGSVGLLVADAAAAGMVAALRHHGLKAPPPERFDAAERLSVVPASQVKGLEFDQVVVVEPAAIAAAEPRGLRRLYIVLTRAVGRLWIVHAAPLPAPLAAAGGG